MIALLKKELWMYFSNGTAWLIIAAFGLISALFLFVFENNYNLLDIGTASMIGFFQLAPWLLLLVLPAISMKAIAEERQNGTLQWLFSQPISILEILTAKFINVLVIGILCLLPSLMFLLSIHFLAMKPSTLDWGMTFGAYLGTILLIAAFSALGILASAIAKNQIIAFLLGLFLNFFFYFGIHQLGSYRLLGKMDYYLQYIGFQSHYNTFTRGLIDSRDVFYFLITIAISFYLSNYFILKDKK